MLHRLANPFPATNARQAEMVSIGALCQGKASEMRTVELVPEWALLAAPLPAPQGMVPTCNSTTSPVTKSVV